MIGHQPPSIQQRHNTKIPHLRHPTLPYIVRHCAETLMKNRLSMFHCICPPQWIQCLIRFVSRCLKTSIK